MFAASPIFIGLEENRSLSSNIWLKNVVTVHCFPLQMACAFFNFPSKPCETWCHGESEENIQNSKVLNLFLKDSRAYEIAWISACKNQRPGARCLNS